MAAFLLISLTEKTKWDEGRGGISHSVNTVVISYILFFDGKMKYSTCVILYYYTLLPLMVLYLVSWRDKDQRRNTSRCC